MLDLIKELKQLGVTIQKQGRVIVCKKNNTWMRVYKDKGSYFVLDFVHDYYSPEPIEYIIDVFREA